jgi:hypothetical protein
VDDVDGDGVRDVVVTDFDNNAIVVLTGNADGTLDPAIACTTGRRPLGVAIGDFDADGRVDLAVASRDDGTITVHPVEAAL